MLGSFFRQLYPHPIWMLVMKLKASMNTLYTHLTLGVTKAIIRLHHIASSYICRSSVLFCQHQSHLSPVHIYVHTHTHTQTDVPSNQSRGIWSGPKYLLCSTNGHGSCWQVPVQVPKLILGEMLWRRVLSNTVVRTSRFPCSWFSLDAHDHQLL